MIPLIRGWTSVDRTALANIRLGTVLSFVAGATNAGGFLAVGQYTSHMTGIVSSVADHLVLGQLSLAAAGLAALLAFMAGTITTVWLVNWGLHRHLRSAYGLPLLLESMLLLIFGLFGAAINLSAALLVPLTVLILCFIMGLQNAVITKISKAVIRTTHITGLVTDLGMEIGRLLYINRSASSTPVLADRAKLRIHLTLILSFFIGGLAGAIGFKQLGYVTTLPLALLLLVLVLRPVLQDLRSR
ncbi:MAG: DUF1275 domain-containing protein [Gammaproteobacteria bacterium]|nr:DUF1275 domain-containing protein [Gammaproteobacteria bacterium]MBU0785755.1 DUF1275 domain-containing protein [Gammaproteobacteria bacterium]MBU0813733.1 DUF1275 domain-containing protein [Gammaproteobacteria bacterium]MBU1788795.1 DUF1275 domain-containing protein [Gammaproteobacteria bacterium]